MPMGQEDHEDPNQAIQSQPGDWNVRIWNKGDTTPLNPANYDSYSCDKEMFWKLKSHD